MQTNSTINANSPQFSHKILSLTDSWSFTITFIAMIIGYIRGLWYFTSHPLDQSLISSVAGGWAVPRPPKTSHLECIPCFFLLFSLRACSKSLWDSQLKHKEPQSSRESILLGATLNQWVRELLDKIPTFHLLVRQFWEAFCHFSEVLKQLLPIVMPSITYPFLLPCLFSYAWYPFTLASWKCLSNK